MKIQVPVQGQDAVHSLTRRQLNVWQGAVECSPLPEDAAAASEGKPYLRRVQEGNTNCFISDIGQPEKEVDRLAEMILAPKRLDFRVKLIKTTVTTNQSFLYMVFLRSRAADSLIPDSNCIALCTGRAGGARKAAHITDTPCGFRNFEINGSSTW